MWGAAPRSRGSTSLALNGSPIVPSPSRDPDSADLRHLTWRAAVLLGLAAGLVACADPARCSGDACSGADDGGAPGDAGSGAGGASGLAPWQQETLDAHDAIRANAVPTPAPALSQLTWNTAAASVAQAWASNCDYVHNARRGPYGENLFASAGSGPPDPTHVVRAWASEAADYSYDTNTCAKACGHYTQVVWRSTTSVGCGVATCTTNSPFSGFATWYLWVCDYAPPGNYVGERPY